MPYDQAEAAHNVFGHFQKKAGTGTPAFFKK